MYRRLALLWIGAASAALSACETVDVVVVPVAGVEVFPAQLTLVEGESTSLQAVVNGPGGVTLSGRSVQWRSTAQGIVEVDGTGGVTAAAPGRAYVVASADGFRDSTEVTVLAGPAIVLSTEVVPLTAVAGASSQPGTVGVTNGGNGVLSGLTLSVAYGEGGPTGWLDATLNGTQAPTTMNLVGRAQSLAPGEYRAVVTVSSPAAAGTPPAVEIVLTVTAAPPSIVLETDGVALAQAGGGQEPVTQRVGITNGGGGNLTGLFTTVVYGDGQPNGWLTASLDATEAPTDLALSASPVGLASGIYTATVFVFSSEADNSPQSLAVTFTIIGIGAPGARP